MGLEGVRVLCVEDNPDALAILRRVLTGFGATVIEAARASIALDLLRDSKPDILISDLGMPLMDGFALIREIRAKGHSSQDLPAIALTAFARPEDRRRCLLAGFQVHLSKPVNQIELASTILSLLAGQRRSDNAPPVGGESAEIGVHHARNS
jgi:CheY-like chemotaxis protein